MLKFKTRRPTSKSETQETNTTALGRAKALQTTGLQRRAAIQEQPTKPKEKGMSPNSTFYIYLPVWVAKLKRNILNQKTKPHTIKHEIKKDKHKCVHLMLHRNHVLIVPQKHIHDGYTYKSDITYTNKNKNTCTKHSK